MAALEKRDESPERNTTETVTEVKYPPGLRLLAIMIGLELATFCVSSTVPSSRPPFQPSKTNPTHCKTSVGTVRHICSHSALSASFLVACTNDLTSKGLS
jgi:hypothetical protein